MTSTSESEGCTRVDDVCLHALGLLSVAEALDIEAHVASCIHCRDELAALRPVVDSFAAWRAAVLRPSVLLWDQLVARISAGAGTNASSLPPQEWTEPDWEQVAPGISCQVLSNDTKRELVAMLVRLAPGVEYPPHRHAVSEELHLLDGELWIDDRKLFPGDYNSAAAGTSDRRVWSETGCTCLLITSPSDAIS